MIHQPNAPAAKRPPQGKPRLSSPPPPPSDPDHLAAATGELGGQERLLVRLVPLILLTLALVLLALRALGVLAWPWGVALAPFTLLGFAVVAAVGGTLLMPRLRRLVRLVTGAPEAPANLTPPPDELHPPLSAAEAREPILLQHPELLAAVCHGLRIRRQLPDVLGHSVADPWGIYEAAASGSATELELLRAAAGLHTARFAGAGVKAVGRKPSDSQVLKRAVDAFHRCAAKAEVGRAPLDCTFEHVTVIFGSRLAGRDAQLKAIAPRVRRLLEGQYPQLATASLADGSSVKYADWQRQATQDRRELARIQKDHERQGRKVEELQAELAEAVAYGEGLRESVEALRQKARLDARAEQEQAVGELRAGAERKRAEHGRQLGRLEAERARLAATVQALSAERDALERALFSGAEEGDGDEGGDDAVGAEALAGLRILLVGGHEGQVPPIRERLEALGVQLLHHDDAAAAELVAGMHMVVFWTSFLGHSTLIPVKRQCVLRGVHCVYWARTSPASLVTQLAEAHRQIGLPVGERRSGAGDAQTH